MKIKNPKLTLTVGADVTGVANALDDNNELTFIDINPNDIYETVCLRRYGNEEYKFAGASFLTDVEITDAVNCTLTHGSGSIFTILITDPTKDASCTVNTRLV